WAGLTNPAATSTATAKGTMNAVTESSFFMVCLQRIIGLIRVIVVLPIFGACPKNAWDLAGQLRGPFAQRIRITLVNATFFRDGLNTSTGTENRKNLLTSPRGNITVRPDAGRLMRRRESQNADSMPKDCAPSFAETVRSKTADRIVS